MLVITRGSNTIKSHETTIFLWFSYGFPVVFLWFPTFGRFPKRPSDGSLGRAVLARRAVPWRHKAWYGTMAPWGLLLTSPFWINLLLHLLTDWIGGVSLMIFSKRSCGFQTRAPWCCSFFDPLDPPGQSLWVTEIVQSHGQPFSSNCNQSIHMHSWQLRHRTRPDDVMVFVTYG